MLEMKMIEIFKSIGDYKDAEIITAEEARNKLLCFPEVHIFRTYIPIDHPETAVSDSGGYRVASESIVKDFPLADLNRLSGASDLLITLGDDNCFIKDDYLYILYVGQTDLFVWDIALDVTVIDKARHEAKLREFAGKFEQMFGDNFEHRVIDKDTRQMFEYFDNDYSAFMLDLTLRTITNRPGLTKITIDSAKEISRIRYSETGAVINWYDSEELMPSMVGATVWYSVTRCISVSTTDMVNFYGWYQPDEVFRTMVKIDKLLDKAPINN